MLFFCSWHICIIYFAKLQIQQELVFILYYISYLGHLAYLSVFLLSYIILYFFQGRQAAILTSKTRDIDIIG